MATDSSREWTGYDKLAGLVALALMAGYYVTPIQQTVGGAMHAMLGPATTILPFSVLILLLAGTTGLSSAVLQTKLRNRERMERLQERMSDLRDRLESTRERDDEDAVEELRAEQRDLTGEYLAAMKTQLRPAVWSMLVSVPVFLWLRWVFVAPSVAVAPAAFALPLVGHVAWTATLVGPLKVWLAWYVGCSLSTGLLARKAVARLA
ncbi:EMC3/TMCO1 family protein [Halorussus limi]|uniref:EMC3/TMCO1 family protein n=1 Tax=Halorussus limi TaxID=2938695 RepID=A0A8U0HPY0_9EURY|nr:EMC3/TMCO1 family protein [Halorussus limi]UPV73112.1 EMC3/TMCO1 family protein [Halorussus limi]